MSFASPWFLVAAALAVPVVVAFLMRRRRSVVRVPSTLLWRGASLRRLRNRRFRNLTRLLALIACALAVLALALAAARPRSADPGAGETVAVVVDVSASMGRGEGRHRPIAQARRHLASMLLARGASDRYVIIAAGATPTRLAGPTRDGELLDQALDALAAGRGGADLGAAVDLALDLVAALPSPRVVVLHDGGASSGAPLPPAPASVALTDRRFSPYSSQPDEETPPEHNLGIVYFAARRPSDAESDDEREVQVTVASSSPRARRVALVVEAFGAPLAQRRLEVPPLGEAEVRLRVRTPAGDLVARISPADDVPDLLEADDVARLTQGAVVPPRALLVARADAEESETFFVTQALRAAGVREIARVTPADAQGALRPRDVVVVLDELPAHRLAAPTLYLGTVAAQRSSLPVQRQREIATPDDPTGGDPTRLRSVAQHHPLTQGVSFDGLTVHRALAADPPEGARALVELEGGPVVISGGDGADGWVYVGLDLSRSDLVLRVAFPVLVSNTLALLGGATQVSVARTLPRSEVMLRQATDDAIADAPALALVVPGALAPWLAVLGGLLLAAEALAWRKGWTR